MKKITLSLIAIIFSIGLITNAQIPNSGFENWTDGNPDDWTSTNVPGAGFFNIVQTTDKYSGNYALLGTVGDLFGTLLPPITQSGPDGTGFEITEQYRLFELYYKFTSIGGDRFSVNVALEKGGNPIAQGAVALPTTVSTYTHLSVPLNYTVEDVPDLAIIQILISGPVIGNDVHLGSEMFVDEMSFSLETGISNPATPGLVAKCFPNPASDMINILFNENIPGEVFVKVFDIYGKEVKSIACDQLTGNSTFQFSVAELSPGLYFYSVNGESKHYNGKFNVIR